MRLALVQEELPALPDFASSALGEEYPSPFVYKERKTVSSECYIYERQAIRDNGLHAECGERLDLDRRSMDIQIVFCEGLATLHCTACSTLHSCPVLSTASRILNKGRT